MIRENFPRGFVERVERLGPRDERMADLRKKMDEFRKRRVE